MSTRPPSSKPRPAAQRKTYGTSSKHARREIEAARRKAQRRTAIFAVVAVVLVVGVGALGVVLAGGNGHGSRVSSTTPTTAQATSSGPEGAPIPSGNLLASSSSTGATVDGIECGASEQTAYHIHTHLQVFVNGQSVQIPGGVGIVDPQSSHSANGAFVSGGKCLYWLHTHAADGLIHVESPTQRRYTLGNLFDIWGQPLSTSQVATASGVVTAFLNGKPFTGNPADIVLNSNDQIQLDVGTPVVPYQPFTFPQGL